MDKPRLVIAGASGVVGTHLIQAAKQHYDISILTRTIKGDEPETVTPFSWNPAAANHKQEKDLKQLADHLEGAYAVVNLAGASIFGGRMSEAHKRRILDSRIDSTTTLVTAIQQTKSPPQVFFQASAVGYYGDRGDEILTEDAAPQPEFFLSKVCQAWEAAAEPVRDKVRLLLGRFALVLAKDAAAWQNFLLPIRLFVGGPLGSGKQWYAWIDADDLAKAILYLIETPSAKGTYNFASPNPVRQLDFTRTAAAKLGKPAFMPVPAFALRLVLGGTADALLLPSARVIPSRLEQSGFIFAYPELDAELDKLLSP